MTEEALAATDEAMQQALAAVNASSPFNQLTGVELLRASAGKSTLLLEPRAELLNHAGALHGGVQSALLDTAAGYAAATLAGNVVTVQISIQFLASARAERFEADSRIAKAGKTQLFAEADLIGISDKDRVRVASATAILMKVG